MSTPEPPGTRASEDIAGALRRGLRFYAGSPEEPRFRRATDVVILVLALFGLALAIVAYPPSSLELALVSFLRRFPEWLDSFWAFLYDLLLLWAIVLVVVALLRRRLLVAVQAIGAIVLAVAIGVVAARLATGDLPALSDLVLRHADRPPFPTLRVAASTAVVITASAHLVRPLQRVGRWILVAAQSIMEAPDAVRKATDADAALAAVADGAVGWGFFTQTIIVTDPDIEALKRKLKALESALHHAKFVVINELERNNAFEAWLGTIPGHCLQNIRKPQVHTLTLAHLFPASAVWSGSPCAGHLTKYYRRKGLNRDAPPLFQAVTNGAIPYRHDPHVQDVGHEFAIGPTGSGKSTKLNFDRLSWLRYVDAQVYSFDFKAASYALTLGVGGDFYDLGEKESALAFQPLAGIKDDSERAWAAEWIEGLLIAEGVKVSAEHRGDTWDTLSRMAAGTPEHQLTMSTFLTRAQHPETKTAIKRYTVKGELGHLFDSDHDSLRYGRWQSFEMEKLMYTEAAVAPTLTYLFHRLDARFNMGVPTLLVLDEAWSYLAHPMFAAQLGAWLLLLRSKNVKVVFATQSLAHVADSPIVSTIKESCPNRTWLANPRALDPAINALYRSFGLNDRQIDIIHKMEQKREYYYTSEVGNRKYELGLGPLALAYTTLNDQSDRVFLGELMQQAHGNTQEFNRLLLRHRKLDWAVPMLDDLFAKHCGHATLQAA